MNAYDRDAQGGVARTGLMLALVDPVTREPIAWDTYPPLGPDEIVMPPFWRCHEDGHGYTVLEMEQYLRTTTKENAA